MNGEKNSQVVRKVSRDKRSRTPLVWGACDLKGSWEKQMSVHKFTGHKF